MRLSYDNICASYASRGSKRRAHTIAKISIYGSPSSNHERMIWTIIAVVCWRLFNLNRNIYIPRYISYTCCGAACHDYEIRFCYLASIRPAQEPKRARREQALVLWWTNTLMMMWVTKQSSQHRIERKTKQPFVGQLWMIAQFGWQYRISQC